MFKTKSRFALLSAIVIVMAMGVMLVGNTFANRVEYGDNGSDPLATNEDYHVYLKYSKNKNADSDEYIMMDDTHHAFDASTLWCPGRTEIVYLEVVNNEVFPVDFSLSLNRTDEAGKQNFGNTLTYAVIDNYPDYAKESGHPTKWTEFRNAAGTLTGTLTGNHELLIREPLATYGAKHHLALAIHMDENADSDYMDAVMNLSFNLTVEANYKPGVTDLNNATADQKHF